MNTILAELGRNPKFIELLNKIENNESEEQLYKDWLESNNLLDQGVRDAYKNSIENKFKELYHDDINSYHSRKLNS